MPGRMPDKPAFECDVEWLMWLQAAAVCLRQLLTAAPPLPGIPARALLQRLILQAPTEGFASGEVTSPASPHTHTHKRSAVHAKQ